MSAEHDVGEPRDAELFPGVNAAGALRAGFQSRHRPRTDAVRGADSTVLFPTAVAESYELQGEIARGGMGVIVKARDRELGRDVALKVLRDELSHDAKLVQRFLEEARVTARLDHPGIVPVHEVGRDAQGRAYFAMRLVRGRELKRIIELAHAGAEGWNQTRALSVIQKVCEAMAYAHERGVIHRDLKPANVMVGEFGEVYVMDWGLARAVGGEDTHDLRLRSAPGSPDAADAPDTRDTPDRSASRLARGRATASVKDADSPIVTMDGEVLGTPCYMSPEQAQGRIGELGPRSDVYAVGAMLYHLLAGEMPYVPPGSSVGSRQVLLHLVQGPPRPLHEVRTDIPAELVAICEKAMSRDPEARYPNMLAMADDVRAYLERRVVSAFETGAWAEAKKWVQRNKRLSAALALAVAALAVGLVVSLSLKAESDVNFERAERSAAEANDERDRALSIASFLGDTLAGVGPSVALGRDTTMLREMMDAAWSRIEKGELAAAPEAELRLMFVIGGVYDDIDANAEAQAALEPAVAKAERLFSGDHPLLARISTQLGDVLRERGDLVRAEELQRRGLDMQRRLDPGDSPDLSECLAKLAQLLEAKGDAAEALSTARECLAMRERLYAGDHVSVAQAANNVGSILIRMGDLDGAEKHLRRAIEMHERLHAGDHPSLATSIDNLAGILGDRGDERGAQELHERALEMRRRVYPGDHTNLAVSLNNVALSRTHMRDYEKAESLMREALAMHQRLLPGDNVRVAHARGNLAAVLQARGDVDGAEALYRDCLAMSQRIGQEAHPDVLVHACNLGVLLKRRGDLAGAEELYRRVLALQRQHFAGDHTEIATTLNNLGSLLAARGDRDGAEAMYSDALAMQKRVSPAGDLHVAEIATHFAAFLEKKGDIAGAEALHREAFELRKRVQGDSLEAAESAFMLGAMRWQLGDLEGAEQSLREALRMHRALLPRTDAPRLKSAGLLAGVLARRKRYAEADELYAELALVLGEIRQSRPSDYSGCLKGGAENAAAWAAAEPNGAGVERSAEWEQMLAEMERR